MIKENFSVIISESHPLYEQILNAYPDNVSLIQGENIDLSLLTNSKIIFDFYLGPPQVKKKIIEELLKLPNTSVLSELGCYCGEMMIATFKKLDGAFSTCFYSPTNTYEYYLVNSESEESLLNFFKPLNLTGHRASSPGHGFIYGRTVAMIINEAYFAHGDELASPEDIDKAMLFGVNYPIGPFELARKSGLTPILILLNELYEFYQDPRYKTAPALLLAATQ